MTVFDLMGHFSGLLERPFAIRWTPHTPKFMLGALLIYGFSVVLYCSTRENRRPGEEHGSAKWGSPCCRPQVPGQGTLPEYHPHTKCPHGPQWKGTPPQPPANRHRRLRRGQDKVFLQSPIPCRRIAVFWSRPAGDDAVVALGRSSKKGCVTKVFDPLTPTAPTPSTHSHT